MFFWSPYKLTHKKHLNFIVYLHPSSHVCWTEISALIQWYDIVLGRFLNIDVLFKLVTLKDVTRVTDHILKQLVQMVRIQGSDCLLGNLKSNTCNLVLKNTELVFWWNRHWKVLLFSICTCFTINWGVWKVQS